MGKIKKEKKPQGAKKYAAYGKAMREAYLTDNPHGYVGVHKVHKSKKNYTRKGKGGNKPPFPFYVNKKYCYEV